MDNKKSSIFRKASLDRLSSPESLDVLMQVITPKAWLLLAPLAAMVLFGVVWSVTGTLPERVESPHCILLNSSGLSNIAASSSGRVTALTVKPGDRVTQGQIIGQVSVPELEDALRRQENRLEELLARKAVIDRFGTDSVQLSDRTVEQQRALLAGQIDSARQRMVNARERTRALEERIRIQEELYQRGLVTSIQVTAAREELASSRQDEVALKLQMEGYQGQFDQLKLSSLERGRSIAAQREEIAAQIAENRRELETLRNRAGVTSVLSSPYTGKVVEVSVLPGALVAPGVTLATVELDNAAEVKLEALVFPGLSAGRRIHADMKARIVPSTVKRQEFGFMTGKVMSVADYPSTPQGMMRLLQNENLAKQLSSGEPPLAVRVQLDTASTPSGFAWSASQGPQQRMASGTLCSAEIITRTQRPIELVVPKLREVLAQ